MLKPEYPYSLDPETERIFLLELSSVLDVALWRADELRLCAYEQKETGSVPGVDGPGWWTQPVTGDTRLFGTIEAFLAAWARISLLLYPISERRQPKKPDPARARDLARAKHLRAVLGVTNASLLQHVADRKMRDGWMHFDEDLTRLAVERDGRLSVSATGRAGTEWNQQMIAGAARIVDPDALTVTLPLRGIFSLDLYFHICKDLRDRVRVALHDASLRWMCIDGVWGIPVFWGLRMEDVRWMIRSAGIPNPITIEASSRNEMISRFSEAVAEWRAGRAQP